MWVKPHWLPRANKSHLLPKETRTWSCDSHNRLCTLKLRQLCSTVASSKLFYCNVLFEFVSPWPWMCQFWLQWESQGNKICQRKLWGSRGKRSSPFPLGPVTKYSLFHFSRSRFLHVWSLENKRLLHVIQLPARVRLVRQLEFISNSFDGGSSQVSINN